MQNAAALEEAWGGGGGGGVQSIDIFLIFP